ncbi:hypothetical protein SCHPADRAFT_911937 [Schizopora paradoxa]|uniref:Uncharacterized protein n=1 Tax=Schizopora paradoxa TaxID=27342 RepID=A0A0H2QYE0_9AGAM|nr:hypothetical protein SCHPADRAFT_911937 [Schizopora paradoxa]
MAASNVSLAPMQDDLGTYVISARGIKHKKHTWLSAVPESTRANARNLHATRHENSTKVQ